MCGTLAKWSAEGGGPVLQSEQILSVLVCNFGEIAYLCNRKEANPEIAEFNSLRR